MTRLAILSDIHGNLLALEAVIADAEARGCTAFANLGDSLSGPLWPAETADLLIARRWPTIAGNHERQLQTLGERMGPSDRFTASRLSDAHRDWLRGLPPTLAIDDMLLVHGTPASDVDHLVETVDAEGIRPAKDIEIAARLDGTHARFTFAGHSHLPQLRRLSDGRTVANPGSVGLQAFDDDRPHPHVVETGDPRARYAIREGNTVTPVAVDYDHRAASARAARAGFAGWATWLATGRFAG